MNTCFSRQPGERSAEQRARSLGVEVVGHQHDPRPQPLRQAPPGPNPATPRQQFNGIAKFTARLTYFIHITLEVSTPILAISNKQANGAKKNRQATEQYSQCHINLDKPIIALLPLLAGGLPAYSMAPQTNV
jgi:hypothetical protein